MRRARVARLLDLHLLLLRGAGAVVVVVSDCHRNVPPCARNSLSLSLSLSLLRVQCALSRALSRSLSSLSLSLFFIASLREFNGLALHSLAYASSAFFSSPSASSSLPTSRSPSGSAIDTPVDVPSCRSCQHRRDDALADDANATLVKPAILSEDRHKCRSRGRPTRSARGTLTHTDPSTRRRRAHPDHFDTASLTPR